MNKVSWYLLTLRTCQELIRDTIRSTDPEVSDITRSVIFELMSLSNFLYFIDQETDSQRTNNFLRVAEWLRGLGVGIHS